ncbi:MAG: molybdopterin molybdenumtransferase MoeA [Chitinophagaceae bacterium]|nr:MAG: molybdopterin molybdenumtransferase MoeA [Chitinophagaceae bacterium]
MISVSEAKKIISDNVSALLPANLPLQQAAGLTLAEDVYATTDIPAFPQSSMDGYAFSFNDWKQNKKLKITGEVAAGSNEAFTLNPGNAVRIFTGAAVPAGADTVIMQEKIKTVNGELIIEDEYIQVGNSVRPKGSEIKAGALALEKGTDLTPAAIGFLAGIGITDVKAYPNPSISIIITGNELQQPGKPLQHGQVYESNSFALKAILQQLHINNVEVNYATDKPEIVTDTLKKALQQSDVVLLTGGISVGDYDFVLQASNECGVEKLFHKVKQRPGKPLYFGNKENKLVFGLPGNPSSVLTCFYQYVIPALEKLSSRKPVLQTIQAPLSKPFQKAAGLTHFLKGSYNGKTVTPLDAQESYRLSSFATANCLIQIDEGVTACKEGELVAVYLLPA